MPRLDEEQKVEKFIDGLKFEMRADVNQTNPSTRVEAMKAAINYGANKYKHLAGTVAPKAKWSKSTNATEKSPTFKILTEVEKEEYKQARKCFTCAGLNHGSKTCPFRKDFIGWLKETGRTTRTGGPVAPTQSGHAISITEVSTSRVAAAISNPGVQGRLVVVCHLSMYPSNSTWVWRGSESRGYLTLALATIMSLE
eukprot:TRINITY_DN2819_c0_g1_i1.p1 TRINITY_DN2819_c0_g1~~TRINITY_DN2819_c0_g1_i1.p1  ORF type:complete len:197 (-),score=17.59 TRINITY_DN2819_c0_g1_i1:449-1039(-)